MSQVHRLDIREVPPRGVLVFVGRSNSGKTLLMRSIMAAKCRQFKKAIVMTGSANSAADFAQHVPGCFVHDGFKEDILEQAVDKQDRDQKAGRCTSLLIVLDDLAYMAKAIKSCPVIKRIFFNGRQYEILLLLSMQYCKTFPPEFRSNCNYIFCCFEKNPMCRQNIFTAFNNVFSTFDAFDRAMCAITPGYRAMVLDNCTNKSMAIADNVFWYKAEYPPLQWQMNPGGSMWRYHARNFDPRYYLRPAAAPEPNKRKKNQQDTVYTLVRTRRR